MIFTRGISGDQVDSQGVVVNGYDYNLQVWVSDYRVRVCGHPESMREDGKLCCDAWLYQSTDIRDIERR